jgi:RNA polymerase sigma factor (sigma-70 family)
MSAKLKGMSLSEEQRKFRAVGADEPITVEDILAHPSEAEFEDEFETLLDEMGDAEFGAVAAASEPKQPGATLKNWTTQDFAVIYTRFRPHLERYAKRWLQNPSQIDEVVQDAFLYLMVTLPELDSELGVLRFLKWKTRLICLDVLRASGRAVLRNIDDHELAANLPEHSAALEAADDAAVVRLALSKLNPRHREVLLATMYEEKSITEVATQVALSENATRQLLFRARAAFKVALIGDVDTNGMSAGAILSVAARKAGSELRQQSSRALVSLFILVLAVGSYFTFTGHGSAHAPGVSALQPSKPAKAATEGSVSAPAVIVAAPAVATKPAVVAPENFDRASLAATNDGVEVNEAALRATLNQGVPQQVAVVPGTIQTASVGGTKSYIISCETRGCAASFTYGQRTGLQNFQFNLTVDGYDFTAYVMNTTATKVGDKFVVTGTLSDLVDAQQVVWSNTALQGATVRLEFSQSQIINGMQNAVMTVGIN